MTVRVRRNKRWGFIEYHITGKYPGGKPYERRRKSHLPTVTATQRWAEQEEIKILERGADDEYVQAPKLCDFWDTFERLHFPNGPRGELKASHKRSIRSHWMFHLKNPLGDKRLDEITARDLAELKAKLSDGRKPKTVNNILGTLNTMMEKAEEWKHAKNLPRAQLYRLDKPEVEFWDFAEWEQLVEAGAKVGPEEYAALMLGGRAGLRAGEIAGLAPADVDHKRETVYVRRSVWRGHVGPPKGGKARRVRVGQPVLKAIKALPVVGAEAIFRASEGGYITDKILRIWIGRVERRAGLARPGDERANGRVHKLRHTFASHHAMNGTSMRTLQELLGHEHIETTLRYAHLSPASVDDAVTALEQRTKVRRDTGENANGARRA